MGPIMDLLILHNMTPKCNGREHARKNMSGGQGSTSLVLSNNEQNKEEKKPPFYPMQKVGKKSLLGW